MAAALFLAFAPIAAFSQAVTAPQENGETLRSRLAPALDAPGLTMPKDADDLDAMISRKDFGGLVTRLRSVNRAEDVILDSHWEQRRIFHGAGFILAYSYMIDLWRLGSSLPAPTGDQAKANAAMMFLYTLDLIALDGVKCADGTAPGHRQDQLFLENKSVAQYLHSLPVATRMTLGTVSLNLEAATSSLRQNDDVLCSGGMAEMTARLKAQGDKPMAEIPNAPGMVGKTYGVPPTPDYKPEFVTSEIWGPKQADALQKMPAVLTRLLAEPTNAPPAPSSH